MSRVPRAWPHLLVTAERPAALASLFAAARAAGLRLGWLALEPERPPAPLPAMLEEAAAQGAFRAVATGGGRSVAIKPVAGAPVLRDLLREHLRGAAMVLLAFEPAALEGGTDPPPIPRLSVADGELRIVASPVAANEAASARTLWSGRAPELVARLRRPRPW